EAERAGGSRAGRIGDGEAEAVVVVRAVVAVRDLAGVEVVEGESAIDGERYVAEFERAVRRNGGDGVDDLAGCIAGIGAGGQLSAGDRVGCAFDDAGADLRTVPTRRSSDLEAERAGGSRAGRIGDGEAEAIVVVGAVLGVTDLAGVE